MSNDTERPGRGRPRTLNKAQVLEVAMQAYWHEGPARVSLNAICQRAGVSKPSLYREFGNDDGLTHAALGHYADCVLTRVLDILGGSGSFADRIRQVAHLAAQDKTHDHGCLFVKMRAAQDQMGPQTRRLIAEMDRMAHEAYTDAFTRARASGEWTGTVPIPLAAEYLRAQIGLALDHRARGEDPAAILALALGVLDLTDG